MRALSSRLRRAAVALALAVAVAGPGFAAQDRSWSAPRTPSHAQPAIPDARAVPPTSVLGIISGGLSGTYIRIAVDIASVFDSTGQPLRILPIVGVGSLQNISDILNIRDVDIGIVQSDVLAFLRRNASPGLEQNIGYLAKLYDEEVHILAKGDIASVTDLSGKTVNVDAKGSGTALTASVIFEALGVKPKIRQQRPGDRAGQAEARRDRRAGLCDRQAGPAVQRRGRQRPAPARTAAQPGSAQHLSADAI